MNKRYYKKINLSGFERGLVTNVDPADIPKNGFTRFQNFVSGRVGRAACKRHGIRDAGCSVPSTAFEIIQLYYVTLDKAGTKTGFMFAQLKGDTNGLDLYYCEYSYSTGTWGSWQSIAYTLSYTSGGTYQLKSGDVITGATGGATATVVSLTLASGTFAGGDAAGVLTLVEQVGTFEAENLNVGANSNVATIASDSASSGLPAYGGAIKADRLNFSNFRGTVRAGAGHYSDSFPLWIGYLNREKDTKEWGYFNNTNEFVGLYTARAGLEEADANSLISSVDIHFLVSTDPQLYGGNLTERGTHFFAVTYEYDGYQEGNSERDAVFSKVLGTAGGITIDTFRYALEGLLTIDSSVINKRISAINIYDGFTGFEENATIDNIEYKHIQRLDINEDDEIVSFNGTVISGDLNTMYVYFPQGETVSQSPWPIGVFDNLYIKYRKQGTSDWATLSITGYNVVWNESSIRWDMTIDAGSNYTGGIGIYEVKIMTRWELVSGTTYKKYFIHNNLVSPSNIYTRKFGNVNYDRPHFVQGRQIVAGCYSLADAPEDEAKYESNLWRYSEFNTDGNPEPDKLSGWFYTDADEDDKGLVATDFKWQIGYSSRLVILWHKKSIHTGRFNESGLMVLDKEPYPVGLVAADSLYYDGSGYYFIGREKHRLGVFYFNPQAGKPKRVDYPIADQIKSLNIKNIDRTVGWFDAEQNRYMIATPEFEV